MCVCGGEGVRVKGGGGGGRVEFGGEGWGGGRVGEGWVVREGVGLWVHAKYAGRVGYQFPLSFSPSQTFNLAPSPFSYFYQFPLYFFSFADLYPCPFSLLRLLSIPLLFLLVGGVRWGE